MFDVKSDGWFNLLHAIGDMPLSATVAFSSIAGRFGNGGQTDYSAANDLLCKIASNFRTTRPDTRAIVIDWTAWGGIGMATPRLHPENDGSGRHRHAAARSRNPHRPPRTDGGRNRGRGCGGSTPRHSRGRVG